MECPEKPSSVTTFQGSCCQGHLWSYLREHARSAASSIDHHCSLCWVDNDALTIMLCLLVISLLFFGTTFAQYPPQSSLNLATIVSPVDGNITISYKSPPLGTCRTVFETQQQYTGWVHIPGEYPTNTFFWFVEAREPTQQLTIWLNGGPGTSSMLGMFTENGPCEVVEEAEGVFGTKARDWGWDRASNMLYIDQVYLSQMRTVATYVY